MGECCQRRRGDSTAIVGFSRRRRTQPSASSRGGHTYLPETTKATFLALCRPRSPSANPSHEKGAAQYDVTRSAAVSAMNSKLIFFTGWLGTTAFIALCTQAFLGLFMALFIWLVTPVILFDQWAHEICYRYFELSTIQWYTPLWEERYGMYQRWRCLVAIALLSAFYLCAFFPFACPDRLWQRPRLKWIWTVLLILLGVALGLYGLIKHSPLNLPAQN